MNTYFSKTEHRRGRRRALAVTCAGVLGAALLLSRGRVHAAVPEPDSIVYGTIALGGAPVLATHTNIVVEARRTTTGPAIATYRMGSDTTIAHNYALKVQLQ